MKHKRQTQYSAKIIFFKFELRLFKAICDMSLKKFQFEREKDEFS